MPIETELKLLINAQDIPRLRRHSLFKRARRYRPRKLYSVYYDTTNLTLRKSDIVLRVRRDGVRWIQTVKSGGRVVAGLQQRQEIEARISGPTPNLGAIHDSTLAKYFSSNKLRTRLKPIMLTEFKRASSMLLPARGIAIEASFDRGHIKSRDASTSICELELEIKRGTARHVYETAIKLLGVVPLIVTNESKAERGFALYRDVPMAARKVEPSMLTAQMNGKMAFLSLTTSSLSHFVVNQHGFLHSCDPEYLHQMRVAVRRLRSVFAIFAPYFAEETLAPLITDMRWLSSALGRARDWDVFGTDILPQLAERYADHRGFKTIRKSVTHFRGNARRNARRIVSSARGQGLILNLGLWLSVEEQRAGTDDLESRALAQPIDRFARATLATAYTRMLERGHNFRHLTPSQLHNLRIATKKLRYAVDFFGSLYLARGVKHFREVLTSLQDALGIFNDAVTTARLAARVTHNLKGGDVKEARGIILGWSNGAQHYGIAQMKSLWKQVRASRPFWEEGGSSHVGRNSVRHSLDSLPIKSDAEINH